MSRLVLCVPLCALCLLGACTRFPELDAAVSEGVATADFPALAPLDPLLARAEAAALGADDMTADAARAEAVRARGAALAARETTGDDALGALADRATALRAGVAAPAGGSPADTDRAGAATAEAEAEALAARRRALQQSAEALRAR